MYIYTYIHIYIYTYVHTSSFNGFPFQIHGFALLNSMDFLSKSINVFAKIDGIWAKKPSQPEPSRKSRPSENSRPPGKCKNFRTVGL